MRRQYSDGLIEIEDIRRVLPGYNGHLSRGHTYYLKKHIFKYMILKRKIKEIETDEKKS